jgi:hypothetical protein
MSSNDIKNPIPAALRTVEFFHRTNKIEVRITTTHGDILSVYMSPAEAAAVGQTLTEYAAS